jgi:hypothetical protein
MLLATEAWEQWVRRTTKLVRLFVAEAVCVAPEMPEMSGFRPTSVNGPLGYIKVSELRMAGKHSPGNNRGRLAPCVGMEAAMPTDSESEILRRLLDQFDAQEIREQLQELPTYRHDALVPGDQALPRLMRCIQSSDLDFRGRCLNELVEHALAI